MYIKKRSKSNSTNPFWLSDKEKRFPFYFCILYFSSVGLFCIVTYITCINFLELPYKLPQTGLIKQQILLSHSFGCRKDKIKVLAGLVTSDSCEGRSVPGLSPGFW